MDSAPDFSWAKWRKSTTSDSGGCTIFGPRIWQPALVAAGIAAAGENGMHALRHFYASALLDAGESIKAVSEYLGHANAAFTLRTYTHLMSSSEARTRKAIDAVLARPR